MAGDFNVLVDLNTQQAAQQVERLFNQMISGSKEAGDQLNKFLGGDVEKKVRLRIERDDSGIKRFKSDLIEVRTAIDGIEKAYKAATKVQPGSLTSLRQQYNQAKQARDAISLFGAELKKTGSISVTSGFSQEFLKAQVNLQRITGELRTLENATKSTFDRFRSSLGIDRFLTFGRGVQDLVTIFQSLGIAISALTAPINQATNSLARLQNFELAFKAIGQGAGGAAQGFSEASRIALGLGVTLDTVRNGFQKLTPVVTNSGGTLGDVSSILESLSSRFAAFGLNADESRRVLNGVIQAFAKGKLQAEELTQQISEADPAFKTDLALALGKAGDSLKEFGIESDGTVANLEELVKQGKLTAPVLIRILPALSKSSLLFGKLGDSARSAVEALRRGDVTITQTRTQLDNLNQLSFERFARTFEPVIGSFLQISAVITDFFTRISQLGAIDALAGVISRFAIAGARLVEFLLNGVEGFIRIADGIGKFANAIGKVLGPIGEFISRLVEVPGIIETIGFVMLAGLIKPMKEAINGFRSLTLSVKNFVNAASDQAAAPAIGAAIAKEVANADTRLGQYVDKTGSRLKELRAKFQKPLDPIVVPPAKLPPSFGVSKKILKEVQESKIGIEGLFDLRKQALKDLGDLQDPGVRRATFIQKSIADIERLSTELDVAKRNASELEEKFRALGSPLENPAAREAFLESQEARKEVSRLESQIKRTEAVLLDTDFVPKVDTREVKQLQSYIKGLDKEIEKRRRVYGISTKVNTLALDEATGKTVALRDLYKEKLTLETRIKGGEDVIENGKRLEDLKRQIRSFKGESASIAPDASGFKQRARSVGETIAAETAFGKQLLANKDILEGQIAALRKRLSKPQGGGSRADEAIRTQYEAQSAALDRLNKQINQYTSGIEKSLRPTTSLGVSLESLSSGAYTAEEATEKFRKATLNTAGALDRVNNAIKANRQAYDEANKGLKNAQEIAARASFGSLVSEEANADIKKFTQQINQLDADLPALEQSANSLKQSLGQLGQDSKTVLSGIQRQTKPLQTALADLGNTLGNPIAKIKQFGGTAGSVFRGIAGSIANAFKNIDLGKTFSSIGNAIKGIKPANFSDIFNSLKQAATQAGPRIKDALAKGFEGAKVLAGRSLAGIVNGINGFVKGGIAAFRSLSTGIKAAITAIGPEIAIFAAIAVATAAYNKATERTSKINEEAKAKVEALEQTYKDLKQTYSDLGATTTTLPFEGLEKEISGTDKVLLVLGNTLVTVTDALGRFLDFIGNFSIFGKARDEVSSTATAFERFGKIALAAGGGAAVGAALTSWLGPGAALGAVIGGATGAFVAFAATVDDATLNLEEQRKELQAYTKGLLNAGKAATALAQTIIADRAQLEVDIKAGKRTKGDLELFDAKSIAGLVQAEKTLGDIEATIKGITQRNTIKLEAAGFESYAELLKEINELESKTLQTGDVGLPGASEADRNRLAELKQLQEALGIGAAEAAKLKIQQDALIRQQTILANKLNITREKLKELNQGSPVTLNEKLKELEQQIGSVNTQAPGLLSLFRELAQVQIKLLAREDFDLINKAKTQLEELGRALNAGEIGGSLNAVTFAVQRLQDIINATDFSTVDGRAQIEATANAMGRLGAVTEVVNGIVEQNKLAGYIDKIKQGLESGEIPNSLETIGNLVSALENRAIKLDIDSPELPGVLKDLLETQQKTDELDGKRASITLELIEQGISEGTLVKTLNLIDRQIENLNQKKATLEINTSGYTETLGQIQELEQYKQASEQTTDDLRERKFSIQKERIDTILALEKAASDRRISLIDREIDRVRDFYDERIKALSEKGPAELELEGVRRAELQQQARKGGREGLEARAQLERLDREKQIAELRKKQEAEIAALEKKKQEEKNAFLDREEAVAEKRLALEEKIAELRLSALDKEEAIIDQVLAERAGAEAGQKAANAFNQSFQIAIAEGQVNDPSIPVQFDYDNSNVIAAQEQVIQKENELQAAIDQTNILREQASTASLAEQPALIQAILDKENEITQLIGQRQTAEDNYNTALRDTATYTNDIVLTNENLQTVLGNVAQTQGDITTQAEGTKTATDNAAQSANDAANSFFNMGEEIAGASNNIQGLKTDVDNVTKSTDDAANKTGDIGKGAVVAKGKFEDLGGEINDSGSKTQTLADGMANAANAVTGKLIPALERVPGILDGIAAKMNSIFERSYVIDVRLNVTGDLWTGGPTIKGATYTVNEKGQEGFMNKFGQISPIKKPRYGKWRAPGDGFVIPAHIYSQLNNSSPGAPQTGISHANPVVSGMRRDNSASELAKALVLMGRNIAASNNNSLDELGKVQAYQAKQIGKLSRAVQGLADKDWSIRVGVRDSGDLMSAKLSTYRV